MSSRGSLGLAAAAALAVSAAAAPAPAAEFGLSHYLPGAAGDILLAESPLPGLQVANTFWYQNGSVGATVAQGQVTLGLDLDLFLDLASASYTWELPDTSLTYTVAALIPFGKADLTASATGPAGNRVSASGDSFNLSDIYLVPFQLNAKTGDFRFKFAQGVVAPTGAYSVTEPVNLGRNYWSFDTVAAVTWFNADTGTEISLAPGIMFNTTNNATDYKTGTEFHLDFTANQFLTPSFSVGLRGYWYQQLTGDSGSGAVLGPFKSESVGIGPGIFWSPAALDGRLVLLGKYMFDVQAENRFKSDYATLSVAWKF